MAISGIPALFVGDLNAYSKGFSRLKAFRAAGVAVDARSHTPRGDDDLGHPRLSLGFRISWKLGFHPDTEGVNRWLLDAAARTGPRIVWIEKGNMVRRATLERLTRVSPGCCIASYTDDDMVNRLNSTWTYRRALSAYDIVFTTKSHNADPGELPAMGARRVVMVDKAYDPDQHFPVEVTDEDRRDLGADVGFIGSFEHDRAEQMLHVARSGIRVRVWGNGWEGYDPGEPNLRIEGRPLVNAGDRLLYTRGICATRINLAFLRKANRDRHTDRSIEIPACGGFMLAEHSEEHARLFEEGREAAYFRDREELVEKIRYYLAHEDERAAAARAGRERCIRAGYRHEDRVRFMIGAMLVTCGGTA